jgi:hypothetical protein
VDAPPYRECRTLLCLHTQPKTPLALLQRQELGRRAEFTPGAGRPACAQVSMPTRRWFLSTGHTADLDQ